MNASNSLIREESWQPLGVDNLETTADQVVRSDDSCSVIAGPGAGKTELLAQKAAYLLQTGKCPYPRRILAISFKTSSAKNLGERIKNRCRSDQAVRFHSMTYDAFAKSLLDRFCMAIPQPWRPSPDYQILFPKNDTWQKFLNGLDNPPVQFSGRAALNSIRGDYGKAKEFERLISSFQIPDEWPTLTKIKGWAMIEWWHRALHGAQSTLTFPMIQRLAEYLLRTNPRIIDALRITYAHVFLDEFQDTTKPQYQLVKTAFQCYDTRMTAVGDHKQKIMAWAGAMPAIFDEFNTDFSAERKELRYNYRSVPELVKIQHNLAVAIDPEAIQAQSQRTKTLSVQHCAVWDFPSREEEADHLVKFIMESRQLGIEPREIVLLVRQKADEMEKFLRPIFSQNGISLRNEARTLSKGVAIQELWSETLVELVMSFLKFGSVKRDHQQWRSCYDQLAEIRAIDPDDERGNRRLQDALGKFHKSLYSQMQDKYSGNDTVRSLVADILHFLPEYNLISSVPQYQHGEW
ncbi:MAG: ATP-dependent helicase [Magnetococcales bacterium]|nr:ATP-dependent helicase [Magnetococcales bacterium]